MTILLLYIMEDMNLLTSEIIRTYIVRFYGAIMHKKLKFIVSMKENGANNIVSYVEVILILALMTHFLYI